MGWGSSGDTGVPPGCATVDAACLGPLPSGWQPIAVTDAGCDPGFAAATLVMNPRVADGGCACGACQVIGTFACEAGVPVSGGNTCTDPTLVTAVPGACTPAQAQHVEAYPPTAAGNIACFAANDAGTGVTVDPLTVCIPDCTADYCASPSRCIVADDALPCPTGFTLLATAGTSADPGCAPCSCEAGAPGKCGGTVTVYDNGTCSDSGTWTRYLVGTCNQFSENDYESLRVDLVPPPGSCFPSSVTPDPGDASLVQARTICCQ